MCHSNNDDPSTRKQIRLAGIQGLQVRIRKAARTYSNIYSNISFDIGRCEKNSFRRFGREYLGTCTYGQDCTIIAVQHAKLEVI